MEEPPLIDRYIHTTGKKANKLISKNIKQDVLHHAILAVGLMHCSDRYEPVKRVSKKFLKAPQKLFGACGGIKINSMADSNTCQGWCGLCAGLLSSQTLTRQLADS